MVVRGCIKPQAVNTV